MNNKKDSGRPPVWKDFTQPLPANFHGTHRERILLTWENHFKRRGRETRRVKQGRRYIILQVKDEDN